MNKVLPPWKVAKVSIAVPTHVWYLTEASNWMPSKRNMANPLNIGRSNKARQTSESKPNRVATLKYLSCHLRHECSINNGGTIGFQWPTYIEQNSHIQLQCFDWHQLLEIVRDANIESPC